MYFIKKKCQVQSISACNKHVCVYEFACVWGKGMVKGWGVQEYVRKSGK